FMCVGVLGGCVGVLLLWVPVAGPGHCLHYSRDDSPVSTRPRPVLIQEPTPTFIETSGATGSLPTRVANSLCRTMVFVRGNGCDDQADSGDFEDGWNLPQHEHTNDGCSGGEKGRHQRVRA